MIEDLTALPMANASLLDEGTAAAEAVVMCVEHARSTGAAGAKRTVFWVQRETHPQTIAVTPPRPEPLGIELRTGSTAEITSALGTDVAGVLLSYPTTDGRIDDHR